MEVLVDIETDSLNATKIHCIVCKDLLLDDIHIFVEDECYTKFPEFAKKVTRWYGHNIIKFDIPVLVRLTGIKVTLNQITDTFIMSQLFNPERLGGHSLANWGNILGFPKIDFKNFEEYSEEMLEYCIQDVNLNEKALEYLQEEGRNFSLESIRLEHEVAFYIDQMEKNGVGFDEEKADILYAEVTQLADEIEQEIKKYFKPIPKVMKTVHPKKKKDGSLSKVGLTDEEFERCLNSPDPFKSFDRVELIEFNLDSPKQIVERLNNVGWKPFERTVGYSKALNKYKKGILSQEEFDKISRLSWKVNDANLSTIPSDAPKTYHNIALWKMLASRGRWINRQCRPNVREGRIHGRCRSLGAVTTRMTHDNPNLANITRVKYGSDGKPILGLKGKYGYECRELFKVNEKDRVLVGADADGLELRCLAQYMGDKQFTKAVVSGKKSEGTDPHTLNMKRANLPDRDIAKTFIYALVYGAQDAKIGNIINKDIQAGRKLRQLFLRRTPKLGALIRRIQNEARKDKMILGIDGRYLNVRKNYASLNTLLQSAGAIICKLWMCFVMRRIKKEGLDAKLVLNVHDELQFDCHKDHAERLGQILINEMRRVGKHLNLNVPLKANYQVGRCWAETH